MPEDAAPDRRGVLRIPSIEPPEGGSSPPPEAPWPAVSSGTSGRGTVPERSRGRGVGGGRRFRLVLLLGALAAITAAGIVIGRSFAPSSTVATTVPVTTTPAVAVPPPPAPVHTVHLVWGPLRATPFGKFPPGGNQAAAAVVGPTLAVVGGVGSARVLGGPVGGRLGVIGALTTPLAAIQAFPSGGYLYLLGGENGTKPTDQLFRIDLAAGRARPAGTFEEPLAAAGVAPRGNSAYLVGGWTGSQFATAVLRFTPPGTTELVARLPDGTRSPAVALLGHTLYVAGGRTEQGVTSNIYAIDINDGSVVSLGQLPQAVEQAVLVPNGTSLYLLGGKTANGKPSTAVIRIDPATGNPTAVGKTTVPLVGAAAVSAGSRSLVIDAPSGTVYRVT
jgi:Galactose oxidase, central domain